LVTYLLTYGNLSFQHIECRRTYELMAVLTTIFNRPCFLRCFIILHHIELMTFSAILTQIVTNVKGKIKDRDVSVSKHHAVKAFSKREAPYSPNLITVWRGMISFTFWPLEPPVCTEEETVCAKNICPSSAGDLTPIFHLSMLYREYTVHSTYNPKSPREFVFSFVYNSVICTLTQSDELEMNDVTHDVFRVLY